MTGKIVKGIAGFYYVYAGEAGIYECKAKGIFRKLGVKPLVGDDVSFEITDPKDMEGNITAIHPRRNELVRPAASNVDQALVLFSLRSPDPNFMLLDRFLLSMDLRGIPAAICFNKTDLGDEADIAYIRSHYGKCGHALYFMCVADGSGVPEVRAFLSGKTTLLAGVSGVGKSSFTNAVQDRVRMETGEISRKLMRGKNTTRHAEIVPVGEDTYLMDTPGFSFLELQGIEKEDLRHYYAEFDPYEGNCRFDGCVHVSEPDCRVKEALAAGEVSELRYQNYCMIFEELKEMEKRRW